MSVSLYGGVLGPEGIKILLWIMKYMCTNYTLEHNVSLPHPEMTDSTPTISLQYHTAYGKVSVQHWVIELFIIELI